MFFFFFLLIIVESGLLPKLKRKTGMGSTGGKREVLPIYNKMVEIFEGLAELIEKQTLTDTTILRVSIQITLRIV